MRYVFSLAILILAGVRSARAQDRPAHPIRLEARASGVVPFGALHSAGGAEAGFGFGGVLRFVDARRAGPYVSYERSIHGLDEELFGTDGGSLTLETATAGVTLPLRSTTAAEPFVQVGIAGTRAKLSESDFGDWRVGAEVGVGSRVPVGSRAWIVPELRGRAQQGEEGAKASALLHLDVGLEYAL